MRKVVLSILVLLLFQTILFSDSDRTNYWYNGNYWTRLDDTGRIYFIVGFGEGKDSIYFNLYSKIKFQKTKDLMGKTMKEEYSSEGITYGALVDFLDKFYSSAQYRIIPIDDALQWFHLSANGKITVNQIDNYATEMLKFFAENPPKMT